MKEKLKTVFLISLVGMSFFMTQRAWMKVPTEVLSIFKDTGVEAVEYELSDMIVPNKYLLTFNRDNHTLVYDDSKYEFWDKSKNLLIEILGEKSIEIENLDNVEYLDIQGEKSAIFYFSDNINTYILLKAWDIDKSDKILDSMPSINKIYVYLGNGDPFFVFSHGSSHIRIKSEDIDNSLLVDMLDQIGESGSYPYYYSMRNTLGTENDIYIPYEISNSLPDIYVENKISSLNHDERGQLAENFFGKKIDYIREIVEENGSTIYIYNEQVLKINTNGTIEFFESLRENIRERNLLTSLISASNFIASKTDAQKGMYLARVEEIERDGNLGYKLFFRYRVRGIPVILGNQEVGEYVEIEVFNNHIRSYKYYARRDMNKLVNKPLENSILSAFEVLDKNYEFLREVYLNSPVMAKSFTMDQEIGEKFNLDDIGQEILSSIEDITLAYFDPCLKERDEKLIPVWVIRLKGNIYGFDANNGILVYNR